ACARRRNSPDSSANRGWNNKASPFGEALFFSRRASRLKLVAGGLSRHKPQAPARGRRVPALALGAWVGASPPRRLGPLPTAAPPREALSIPASQQKLPPPPARASTPRPAIRCP